MASIAVSHIDKELECSVCLFVYEKPKLLKCMHTFCEDCILKIVDGNQTITCPICRVITKKTTEPLPTNFIVANLVNVLQDQDKQPKCHDCVETSLATHHCNNCKLNLCNDCMRYHQNSLKFSGHQVVGIKQVAKSVSMNVTSRYCQLHKELLKYYCEDCSSLVCNDCMISAAHKSHNFCIVDEVKVKLKQQVNDLVAKGKMLDETLDRGLKEINDFKVTVEENKKISLEAVKTCFKEIRDAINEREAELTKNILEQADVSAQANVVVIESQSQSLKKMLEYVDELSQNKDDGNLENVEVLCDLKKQLEVFVVVSLTCKSQCHQQLVQNNGVLKMRIDTFKKLISNVSINLRSIRLIAEEQRTKQHLRYILKAFQINN